MARRPMAHMSGASIAVLIVCAICGAVSGLVGELTRLRMVDDLNRERPPDAKFTSIGWSAQFETTNVLTEYRRLRPGDRLLGRVVGSYVCGWLASTVAAGVLVGVLGAMWLGFGGAFLGWLTWWFSSPRTS